jgi:uncharacterized membrane protein
MEELFKTVAETIATLVEAGAVLVIAVGSAQALYRLVKRLVVPASQSDLRLKSIWVKFAIWLVLGLEFELAADVVRTSIAPSWDAIGQLAAIAVIRTFLNYFLEKDIEKYLETYEEPSREPGRLAVAAPLV